MPSPPPPPTFPPDRDEPGPDFDSRLVNLEEAAAFAERTVEQLSIEVAELGRRLRELTQRTDALERRLTGVVEDLESREEE